MSVAVTTPDFLAQLRELRQVYSGRELESALGITARSMQKYLLEENPTQPGKEVVRKIREVYARHVAGQPIAWRESSAPGDDYRDKYVRLLEERLSVMEKENEAAAAFRSKVTEEIRAVRSELGEVSANLKTMVANQVSVWASYQVHEEFWLNYHLGSAPRKLERVSAELKEKTFERIRTQKVGGKD